ncbi:hypothetical protein [Amycolatopsis thermophila]|uniref:Uncharacterized protein n=1 Tax=Amycolatopsis thermophila TaxID=206084 RepID=A0ABU0F5T2_9PSEU|nr:hypothetical protein [Amycolatopsis thermophila]MDQ0382950.1 hypothetical protein [Amycolatopsis thermophila]
MRRYEHAARFANEQHLDEEITRVLARRAPAALGRAAEPALRALLHRVHAAGWPVEHAVPDADSLVGIDLARDPAAVLYRRVEQRIHRSDPPDAPLRPRGPLPWLESASTQALADRPDSARHLDQLAQAIAARAAALREETVATEPDWAPALPTPMPRRGGMTSSAGRRVPRDLQHHQRQPGRAPGLQPRGTGPRAQAWKQITDRWRPTTTSPSEQYARNQQRINALRDQMIEGREDLRDDREDLAADYRAEAADGRADAHEVTDFEAQRRYDDLDSRQEGSGLGTGLS